MAVFTKTCDKNIVAKPINARLEKRSFDKYDCFIICTIKYPNTIRMTDIVINPNSSPITDNIKSDSCTGKNFKWVWVPSPQPLPNNPPEPIAVLL